MINNKLVYISIIISGLLVILLATFPKLDIAFSELFYHQNQGFIYRYNLIVRAVYLTIPIATKVFTISCSIYIIYRFILHKKFKNFLLSKVFYLFITALIGPGLVVNTILKENFGRARPAQISYFAGTKNFTNTLLIADQCTHNCSFPSGHSAMAYYFTATAYVLALSNKKSTTKTVSTRRFTLIYILFLFFGSLVGFSRILMGGHFLSDIAASCFIVLVINHLLYLCWKKPNLI